MPQASRRMRGPTGAGAARRGPGAQEACSGRRFIEGRGSRRRKGPGAAATAPDFVRFPDGIDVSIAALPGFSTVRGGEVPPWAF